VHGNYLKASILAQGLDPDRLPVADKTSMNFGSASTKAWRDIWGAGQGVAQSMTCRRWPSWFCA